MALTASELAMVSRLLDEALALREAERERWLQALPAEHAPLAPALREVLARAQTASALMLDRPLRLSQRRRPEPTEALRIGARVGPYELVRELGTGGMAEVWLARRADGAYRRDVALKLPKLARSRSDLERLFARERDIQASLEHPNIARLYDAGISPEGLPYLAMEFVHGRPLTVWCDAHRIGLRERLQLILQVTDAVQYAHARKIIHRDLKPSNILVTESGHVRLLDFGIAKLLADEETDRRLVHVYARALTPDYASPELLRGEPVEAASDVYSLGAVLYELLAGNRPYRLATGLSAVQLVRAVADAPVEAPSKRVAPGAGAARATTQDRLVGRLRGALDAVVLKALAWCPADRYRDIAALADDLQRYLSGEPVEALPDRLTAAELIAALSRNPKVRVRGLASRSRSENGNTPAVTVADSRGAATPRANVDHKPTRTLRITVQLLSAATETQLWVQNYDLEVDERLEVKEGIAGAIADAVEAALGLLRSDDEGKNAKS